MLRHRKQKDEDSHIASMAIKTITTIKEIDFYPKVDPDVEKTTRVRTDIGGVISIITISIMIFLFFFECSNFFNPKRTEHIIIDTDVTYQIPISFSFDFPSMSCDSCVLDLMDITGEVLGDKEINWMNKQRTDKNGKLLGAPIPISSKNRDRFIRKNVQLVEGCRVQGSLTVKRVAGNFHFAAGHGHSRMGRHTHDFQISDIYNFNTSHSIKYLQFGEHYSGRVSPLDNMQSTFYSESGQYQYYISIVPTTYISGSGFVTHTYQYSYTQHFFRTDGRNNRLPGVFFMYDIAPYSAVVQDIRPTILHFFTSLCAIVGGMFTIGTALDSILFYIQHDSKNLSPLAT